MRPSPETCYQQSFERSVATPQVIQSTDAHSVSHKRKVGSVLSILSASILLSVASGCAPSTPSTEGSDIAPTPAAPSEAIAPAEEPSPAALTADQLLSEATAQAGRANALAQSAQSRDDWALVASLWEQAIAMLDQIPEGAPEHANAQQAKATYAVNLGEAQQAADIPVDTTPRLHAPLPASDEETEAEADETADPDATPDDSEESDETEESDNSDEQEESDDSEESDEPDDSEELDDSEPSDTDTPDS
ncbi:hypothetical protein [Vacuolonema iberomarrocanum]|uniref:hypothetical protein n=1 Tax=Vacuolonema iberomarrocanum TaxID=3454632 RepID=UPI0019DA1822|nr:hypothetical protein [filamentous cyanobacterium LEGE 07170]